IGILAGQLGYLFDDEPELEDASDADLAARIDHNDRWSRARKAYPPDTATDEQVRAHLDEFPTRITAEHVALARRELQGRR
ncbi:MAG: hypothetical protein ABW073_02405, partial [Acidimicrobiia bacterium]